MAKISEISKTLKAWVAAAVAGLTGLSAFIVPESTVGVLLASVVAFLVALGAVFQTGNAPDVPKAPERVDSLY